MRQHSEVFIDKFQESLHDLLECYTGVRQQATEDCQTDAMYDLIAVVGLCDNRFRASVSLTTTCDLIENQFKVKATFAPDYLGELCNQLVGRLKNKLTVFGLQPNLSTPTIVSGEVLSVNSFAGDTCTLRVDLGDGQILAQMSLEVDDELQLVENSELTSLAEGSLQLF